jgi:N-acetylneuraminic acid mutarotase
MGNARTRASATLLHNGLVLVAGGGPATAELYDSVSGTWSFTGSLPFTLGFGHTATLLPNGSVLVTGGISDFIIANAEIYNPKSGTWNATGNLTVIRLGHTATLLRNGKVLIAAGESTGGVEVASAELGVRAP